MFGTRCERLWMLESLQLSPRQQRVVRSFTFTLTTRRVLLAMMGLARVN